MGSAERGRARGLAPARVHGSLAAMLANERTLPPAERVDFVSVVTPNHLHFPMARDLLAAGIHVVCEKPMTFDAAEARRLASWWRGPAACSP